MKVLVLGGTQFVGRAIVQALLDKGYDVSIFHRGRTGADLFPQCEHILGDRTEDISKASGQDWDAVIDVSCYQPDQARAACKLRTKRYVFISTCSVYDLSEQEGPFNESQKVLAPLFEDQEITGETYGPLKVGCENILRDQYGAALNILRPGIIVGENDHTGRYPYWVARLDACVQVLVPDKLDQRIQWIDSRDLADFTVLQAESGNGDFYNAIGPRLTFGQMLDAIRAQLNHENDFVVASLEQLEKMDIKLWVDLPLIFPAVAGPGLFNFDPAKAVDGGLKLRSIEETTRTTLNWVRNFPNTAKAKYGMDRERELAAMEALQKS